jgi:hypothetical protein
MQTILRHLASSQLQRRLRVSGLGLLTAQTAPGGGSGQPFPPSLAAAARRTLRHPPRRNASPRTLRTLNRPVMINGRALLPAAATRGRFQEGAPIQALEQQLLPGLCLLRPMHLPPRNRPPRTCQPTLHLRRAASDFDHTAEWALGLMEPHLRTRNGSACLGNLLGTKSKRPSRTRLRARFGASIASHRHAGVIGASVCASICYRGNAIMGVVLNQCATVMQQ